MKGEEVRKAYYAYSKTASKILRQLGFAGIAVVWVFKNQDGSLPILLIWAAWLVILGLTLDLFQYIAGSIIWSGYNLWREYMKKPEDEDFTAPRPINWITTFLYAAKSVVMIAGYILILCFLAGHVAVATQPGVNK